MKAITDGNYIVRPFVTHKTQTYGYAFLSGGNPAQVSIDLAVVPPTSSWQFASGSEPINPSGIYKRSLYESVKHMFYDTSTVDRLFQPTASALYVISMAQPAYGEQIKPGTFALTEGTSIGSIVDDGNGGLIYTGSLSASIFSYTVGTNTIASLGGTFTGPATRSYRDITGSLKYAVLNEPRDNTYMFNTTSSQFERVLLLESASTNALTFSSNLENAAWTVTNAGFSASAIISPDGTLAGKLVETSTGSVVTHTINRTVSTTVSTTATQSFSIFLKAAERTTLDVYLTTGNGWFGTSVDATTGTMLPYNGGACKTLTSSSVQYGNGWYHYKVSGVTTGSTNTQLLVRLKSGSSQQTNYIGDGVSGAYVWGAQLEVNQPVNSSYIPTVSASVTRTSEYVDFPFVDNINTSTFAVTSIPTAASGSNIAPVSASRIVPSTGFGYKSIVVSRQSDSYYVGNIFYETGIAIINSTTRQFALSDIGLNLTTGSLLNVKFGATHTIYEHYIICSLDQGELNYSSNPSMKQLAADGLRVVDHMATGSLHPYMTQIGLYNDNGELMALGKFPRPLKRAVGSQQTVIIRFDA